MEEWFDRKLLDRHLLVPRRQAYEKIRANAEQTQKSLETTFETARKAGNDISAKSLSALRANAEGIAPNVAPTQERLADGRLGVRGLASEPTCQLRAVWIPVLNAEVDLPQARRLEGTQAFQALLSSLRVLWAPLWMAHLLPQLSHLARIVPLYRVEIPRHILTEPAQQQALVAIAQQHQGSDE